MRKTIRFDQTWFTYRKHITVILIGLGIGALSVYFSGRMAQRLREKEQYEINLWVRNMAISDHNDPILDNLIRNHSTIPYVILDYDNRWRVEGHHLIPEKIVNDPELLEKEIRKFAKKNAAVDVIRWDGKHVTIFYGESALVKLLLYFPYIQTLIILIFIAFGYITFRSTKQNEQNRVWIGLAKETAHQLGTPTSSLLGWVEYLRNQSIDQSVVDEMSNDLTRLMKVAERFSKIGSEAILTPANINEVVGNTVLYFRSRIPKNVRLDYNGLAIAPVKAMINGALFEWVVENLLKNALDALQGRGSIDVRITSDYNWVYIDVNDTGKGIPKANFKRIFEPGYTTKTRGWGLGLSLSKRIIESNHKGRIFVLASEPGKCTTMRIMLKKIYE